MRWARCQRPGKRDILPTAAAASSSTEVCQCIQGLLKLPLLFMVSFLSRSARGFSDSSRLPAFRSGGFYGGFPGLAAGLLSFQLADFPGEFLEAVKQALFHVPDAEQNIVNIVSRWGLEF